MTQSLVVLLVQLFSLLLLVLLSLALRRLWRRMNAMKRILHYSREGLPPSAPENLPPEALAPPQTGKMDLPLAILPLSRRSFSPQDIAAMVAQFQLKSQSEGHYYLAGYDGETPLLRFTAMNIEQHFGAAEQPGILLTLPLPNPEPASHAVDIFLAVAQQLASLISGRLCTPQSHQTLNEQDFENYRRAARDFHRQQHAPSG